MSGHACPKAAVCRLGGADLALIAALLFAMPACAQTSPPQGASREKPVVVPPITDEEAVKKPPEHVDQDAIARPPKVEPQMRDKARPDRKDKDDKRRAEPPQRKKGE